MLGLVFLAPMAVAKSQNVMAIHFNRYVNDYAHMLSSAQVDSLNQKLINYDHKTSNQIVVTTLASIGDNTVEDVANKLFTYNGIGTKQHDNGVLLLIVKDGHHIRIEVGYGLEGQLTDALSGMIIRNDIAPAFKQQKYDKGVQAAVNSIIQVIGGTYKAPPQSQSSDGWYNYIFVIIFIFFWIAIAAINARGRGFGAFLVGLFLGSGGSSGSHFSSGGSGFSGGGDDDSFSGGGGGSGGGGASGGW